MVFTSAALSIIFLMAWRNLGRKSYALTWACAFAVATLQWTLYLTSNWFSNPAAHWLLISLLAIMMMTLNLRGHCQRTDCGLLPTNLWPYAGALFFVILWTTMIDRHAGLSTMLVPAAAAMSLLLSAWIIVRHRERTRPAEWAAAISLVLFALSQLVAAGIALGQGTSIESGYQSLFMHYNFITLPTGYLATSMFIVFMVASDISEEMKEIAVRDELTGLYNRRGLSEHGAQAYAAANRSDRPISVVMTDSSTSMTSTGMRPAMTRCVISRSCCGTVVARTTYWLVLAARSSSWCCPVQTWQAPSRLRTNCAGRSSRRRW